MSDDPQPEPSPYDALGETLWRILGDQLHEAITSPAFATALKTAAIAVVPACDDVPEPPEEWLEDGLELLGQGDASIVDPAEHLDGLWRTAYESGWHGYAANREDFERELERSEGVKAELRRQFDAQLRQVARLRWAARYLPDAIRRVVLAGAPRPGVWHGERPDDDWANAFDQRATDAGLTPYPKETNR
jgi:hypothetical protein